MASAEHAAAQTCGAAPIQAESAAYSSGVDTEPTSDTGGGLNVGWIDTGDWLSYAVSLPQAGTYTVSYRVASNVVGGGRLQLETDSGSTVLGALDVPSTNGWQNWVTISHVVELPFQGNGSLGIAAVSGGWNLNWLQITPTNCSGGGGGITAGEAAAAMGRGFNLGQMFENTQHPRTFAAAKAKIDAYYAKGFRNVRIPITWTDPVGGDRLVYDANVGQVDRGHPRLAVIEQTVDYALSKPGMYVVINAHHERVLKTDNRWWVLERLWQDIADIFRERDHRLLFEILNEPHREGASAAPMPAAELRFMTGKAYAKIRAVDPQRIVIIGGNQWFHYSEMAQVWPHLDDVGSGNDAYLMATFHHYSPWSFCGDHQGDYADSWSSSDIIQPMEAMKDWAASVGRGMPVYIGEWGVGWGSRYSDMQCNNIRLWYQLFDHDVASSKGMPTSVWDDGGWFGSFSHSTNDFSNNLADCISGTCDWTSGERFNSACF
ncbi:cellulase family glycosylhydrolase [Haliangium ochraceum]|uniref:cellulase family glycosylhydrolase n=1 Tax=Haliangium ochraceum TaxID=80816 RepID=UPI000BB4E2CD|nr:cellulase family glycosylhydrolase [Haliangium ochraceum]